MASRLVGDWQRAGMVLRNLSSRIGPVARAKLYDNGELVLERLQGHIDAQDLNWTPLKESTVKIKHGDDTIYVESGWLRDNLSVRRLKSSTKGSTIFVGASPWKVHPSGVNFSDLMIWMEYGTTKMPPRPLIRPTFEEVKSEISKSWKQIIIEAMGGV